MRVQLRRQMWCALLAAGCWGALAAEASSAQGSVLSVPLAQAAPPIQPANVTAPPRYYIIEGIVIVLLFAGAVFAVCRTSGRS